MKQLRPIYNFEKYSDPIAKEIQMIMWENVFLPVLEVFRDKEARNASTSSLKAAILAGRIQFIDGIFHGKLTSKISKDLRSIGASYDKRMKKYTLSPDRLSSEIRILIAQANATAKEKAQLVEDILRKKEQNPIRAIDFRPIIDRILDGLAGQFSISIKKGSPRSIEIPINRQERDALRDKYSENILPVIKKWHDEEVLQLREEVQANVREGFRAEAMIESIMSRGKSSFRKARFIARQETSLMVSQYREVRYRAAGLKRYQWSTSRDERVRPDHRLLHGQIFDWEHPPVTDRNRMTRNHPGMDFGCFPGDSRVEFLGNIKKVFRRWYSGELTEIITNSGETIRATPNHPVLTTRGWKAICMLDDSDHIVKLGEELIDSSKLNRQKSVSTIRQIFESFRESRSSLSFRGNPDQFHGDGSDHDVDVIGADGILGVNRKSFFHENFAKLLFSLPDFFASFKSELFVKFCPFFRGHLLNPIMSGHRQSLTFREGHSSHSDFVGLRDSSDSDVGFEEPSSNDGTFQPCSFRNGKLTFSPKICFNDRFWIKLKTIMDVSLCQVSHKKVSRFEGYVYNIETEQGYFTSGNVVVSNCRCVPIPVIGDLSIFQNENEEKTG